MTDAARIRPCPFCGNADPSIDEVDRDIWAIVCEACGCTGPIDQFYDCPGQTPEQARARWNRRNNDAAAAVRSTLDEALNSGDGVYRP